MKTIFSKLPTLTLAIFAALFFNSCSSDHYESPQTQAPGMNYRSSLYQNSGMICQKIYGQYRREHHETVYNMEEMLELTEQIALTIPEFRALGERFILSDKEYLRELLYGSTLSAEDVITGTSLSEQAKKSLLSFVIELRAAADIRPVLDKFEAVVQGEPDFTARDKVLISTVLSLLRFAVDTGGDDDDWDKSGDNIFKTALYGAGLNRATAIIVTTAATVLLRSSPEQ